MWDNWRIVGCVASTLSAELKCGCSLTIFIASLDPAPGSCGLVRLCDSCRETAMNNSAKSFGISGGGQ